MAGAITVIVFIFSILAGLMYHEYGHMKVAKKHGIKVNQYVIGFGKPFISRRGKDGTSYGVAPLPFGGYCDIDDTELNASSTGTYVSVMCAGIVRNVIFGVLLFIIGSLIIAQRILTPAELFHVISGLVSSVWESIGTFLASLFDIKGMASNGGFITQMGTVSAQTNAMTEPLHYTVGLAFFYGGIMNLFIAIFNALPIPAIDGGQIVVRLVCDISKKVFGHVISPRTINVVNVVFFSALIVYQGVILMMDIPVFRNFILNL